MTIEHLIPDQGLSDSSYLGNLVLVTAHVNSELLQNKQIVDKINILSTDSSFNVNKSLDKYLNEDNTFDIQTRGKDIYSKLYDKIFYYDSSPFNLNNEDINIYFETYDKVKEYPELLNILKEKGKHFESYLNGNPAMSDYKEIYAQLS